MQQEDLIRSKILEFLKLQSETGNISIDLSKLQIDLKITGENPMEKQAPSTTENVDECTLSTPLRKEQKEKKSPFEASPNLSPSIPFQYGDERLKDNIEDEHLMQQLCNTHELPVCEPRGHGHSIKLNGLQAIESIDDRFVEDSLSFEKMDDCNQKDRQQVEERISSEERAFDFGLSSISESGRQTSKTNQTGSIPSESKPIITGLVKQDSITKGILTSPKAIKTKQSMDSNFVEDSSSGNKLKRQSESNPNLSLDSPEVKEQNKEDKPSKPKKLKASNYLANEIDDSFNFFDFLKQPPIEEKDEFAMLDDDPLSGNFEIFEPLANSSTEPSKINHNEKHNNLVALVDEYKKTSSEQEKENTFNKLKQQAQELEKRAVEAENRLKKIQQFTNSYSSHSVSKVTNGCSPFDSMMSMLSDIYDNEDMEHSIRVYNNFKESECHFAFLYASPLVIYKQTHQGEILQPLLWEIDYEKDLEYVKSVLGKLQCDLNFISSPASVSTFPNILNKNPMILHFCGHGIKNTTFLDQLESNRLNDYLLFEDRFGRAEVLSCEVLSEMIEKSPKGKNTLEFVFVASCHSEIVGEVFIEAGASHVLCVRREHRISDRICNEFTELFYNLLFSENNYTICEAYEMAKKQVGARKVFRGEEDNFVMLLDSSRNRGPHQCTRFIMKHKGEPGFKDLTILPTFSRLPVRVECFRGRNKEMFEIADLLVTFRLVVVKGAMGIGKSSLVREIASKALETGLCKDGIVFVNMSGKETMDTLYSLILNEVEKNSFNNKPLCRRNIDIENYDKLIEIFHNKEALLIIDNVDGLLFHEKKVFYKFLADFLERIHKMKVLVTTFSRVENVLESFTLKVYDVGPLTSYHSAKMLEERAPRRIEQDEIDELFEKHPLDDKTPKSLSYHKLMDYFEGHPQVILMASSFLSSMRLHNLFDHLAQGKGPGRAPIETNNSLLHDTIKASLDYAINIIEAEGSACSKFFQLLWFFPAGFSEEDIDAAWGNKEEATQILLFLVDHSVVMKSDRADTKELYFLNRMLEDKAGAHIDFELKLKFAKKIALHYARKLEKIFRDAGAINTRQSSSAIQNFLDIEKNVARAADVLGELWVLEHASLEKLEINSNFNKKSTTYKESHIEFAGSGSDSEHHTSEDSMSNSNIGGVLSNLRKSHLHATPYNVVNESMASQFSVPLNSIETVGTIFGRKSDLGPRNKINNEKKQDDFFGFGGFADIEVESHGEVSNHSLENLSGDIEDLPVLTKMVSDNCVGRESEISENRDSECSIVEPMNQPPSSAHKKNITNNQQKNPKSKTQATVISTNSKSDKKITNFKEDSLSEIDPLDVDGFKNEAIIVVKPEQTRGVLFDGNEPKSRKRRPSKNSEGSPDHIDVEKGRNHKKVRGNQPPSKHAHKGGNKIPKKPVLTRQKDSLQRKGVEESPAYAKINTSFRGHATTSGLSTKTRATNTENRFFTYYFSILFIMRRYDELESLLSQFIPIFFERDNPLLIANSMRILSCLKFLEKDYEACMRIIDSIFKLLNAIECEIGVALCFFGSGYMKFLLKENAAASAKFKLALKKYTFLGHNFGKLYTLKMLSNITSKLGQKNKELDYKDSIKVLQRVKTSKKEGLSREYKNGRFVIRFKGNQLGLLFEPCLKTNLYDFSQCQVTLNRFIKKIKEIYQEVQDSKRDCRLDRYVTSRIGRIDEEESDDESRC